MIQSLLALALVAVTSGWLGVRALRLLRRGGACSGCALAPLRPRGRN
ncbi:MAG TPA: hypothetical protein VK661_09040 [Planctomycetota bacterium]|nr:hypothetical protein [Planctomycetota bacterium]